MSYPCMRPERFNVVGVFHSQSILHGSQQADLDGVRRAEGVLLLSHRSREILGHGNVQKCCLLSADAGSRQLSNLAGFQRPEPEIL